MASTCLNSYECLVCPTPAKCAERELAREEAVAKALCDACYGAGSWDSISRRPEGAGQVYGWKKQARAAMLAMEGHIELDGPTNGGVR